ncbi:MAG: ComEC/Rec2 family competence protein, partial [Pseudomonadota bacterium]
MEDKRSARARLGALWREERPNLPLWTPVCLGVGIQLYFWARTEPPFWSYLAALAAPIALWTLARRVPPLRLPVVALALAAVGFTLAGARAKLVEAPVMAEPTNAAVEGVIREIGRSASGRARLRLDEVYIFGVPPDETPKRVQVSLQKEEHLEGLRVGGRVSILAHVGPPGGPVEPGGFDFRRAAWFSGLGGIGYANGPPAVIPEAAPPGPLRRAGILLGEIRAEIAAGLRARLPGETGAFAAAVTVGERAGVSTESLDALRDSNLAHLLAISGLHMGIVTGLVFAAARLLLAAIPFTATRWRTKTIAACVALVAATAYLGLSGATVATQRAYVMAAVALIAVIAGRPAITLRALAFAALVILVFRPESLTHVGFQMSFAATAAIIAGLEFGRAHGWSNRFRGGGRGAVFVSYVAGLAATSLLAGLATAPIAAFHFNRAPHYGLIANLAAVPAMGFWVAPSALVATALAPFGLEGPALTAMGRGIEAILA